MAFLVSGSTPSPAPVPALPIVSLVNANASTLAIGTVVYSSAAGAFDAAIANSAATALAIGILAATAAPSALAPVQTGGPIALTTAQWDAVAGTSGGLTFGTAYYVDPTTAGRMTSAGPTASGKYATRIGVGLSPTVMTMDIQPPIGPNP